MYYIIGIIIILCLFSCVLLFIFIKSNKRKITLYEYILQNYDINIKDFEKKIGKDILRQSQKIILYDKLKSEEKNLCLNYFRFRETKNKFETICENHSNTISNEIIEDIESYIVPEYLTEQRRQKYLLMITKISYLTAFLALIPVINDISKFCLLLTLYPLIKLAFLNAPINYEKRKLYFFKLISNLLLLAFIISDVYFSVFVHYHWWTDFDAEIALIISIVCTAILLIPKIIKYIYHAVNS